MLYIPRFASPSVAEIGLLDARILALGVGNGGRIDERVLGSPSLAGAGTGRVMDCLASLAGRGMIALNADKSFRVTGAARRILWDGGIPLWARILKVLEIGPLGAGAIAELLAEDAGGVLAEAEALRRGRLVMTSALRTNEGVEKTYEILPEGAEELEGARAAGGGLPGSAPAGPPGGRGAAGAASLLDEIAADVRAAVPDAGLRDAILRKISRARSGLPRGP